jgi:hypothetical protein
MYDLEFTNNNARVVGCRLERFLKVEENIFVFKTHQAARGVVNSRS